MSRFRSHSLNKVVKNNFLRCSHSNDLQGTERTRERERNSSHLVCTCSNFPTPRRFTHARMSIISLSPPTSAYKSNSFSLSFCLCVRLCCKFTTSMPLSMSVCLVSFLPFDLSLSLFINYYVVLYIFTCLSIPMYIKLCFLPLYLLKLFLFWVYHVILYLHLD